MSKKSTEQVLYRLVRVNRLKEHRDKCVQHNEQLSTRTPETERDVTDYSHNHQAEISCEESSFSDYSVIECVPDTDGSSSDDSCESKEVNICDAEPVKSAAVEFKSTTDTSTSSSYHSSTSVTPMPTKVQRNRYNKKQYCAYCQKPYSKIARHLEFVHRNEPEVAKAFSFDKSSKERRVRLRLLKSRGNFAHNAAVSKAGNGEMVACRRPKEVKSSSDYTHCIHCQGLYNRKTLWRHVRTCPQKPRNEEHTTGQKRVQSINSWTLSPAADVSKRLWSTAREMLNDGVSHVTTMTCGSHLSEPRPSNRDQCTDCNSEHSSTASDSMEKHSQVNRAVPRCEENTPSSKMSKKPTEQVLYRLVRVNRLKEHRDKCVQHNEQLSTRTPETERDVTDYSHNHQAEISCEESSFSDYSVIECVPDTDGSSSDDSCESKEVNVCDAEPVKSAAVEFKSTTDTSTSSSYHSSTSVTPMPTKVQRNRYNKKQYCAYCQKPYSKIARHLEFVHRNEPEVAKAFSFDKSSKERRVRLRLLKSRGNFAHNAAVSKAGNGEMVACRRPKEVKSSSDYTHCIHCQGLYNRKTLWRHVRTCPQKPRNEEHTTGQKRVQSINSWTLSPAADVSKRLWSTAREMLNDGVSHVTTMTVKRVTDTCAVE